MKALLIIALVLGGAWFFFGEELGLKRPAGEPKKGQAAIQQMYEQAEEKEARSQQ